MIIEKGLQNCCLVMLLIVSGSAAAIERVKVHGLFKDKAIVSLDKERRILKLGEPSPEGALLISANSKEAVIEINGVKKVYKLSANISGTFSNSATASITINPDLYGMYRVNGLVNGVRVNFMVDTGSTLVSMNSLVAKRIGLDYRLKGKPGISSTASGQVKVYTMNLKSIQVGGIKLNNIRGAVHEGNFPVEVLLGMSFLNRLNMEREGSLLRLQKRY